MNSVHESSEAKEQRYNPEHGDFLIPRSFVALGRSTTSRGPG